MQNIFKFPLETAEEVYETVYYIIFMSLLVGSLKSLNLR